MTESTATGWEQHAEACRRKLAQGDPAGAERSFAAALAEGEALGPSSTGLAACLTVLAQIRSQQRDQSSAEALFRRALGVREQAAEFDHTAIIQILGHLATLHNARADYDEADALLTRALALADKYLPPSHPAVASLLNNLARLYFKRADHAKADRMLVRLLQIKQALGTEHPEVAGVLASIAALRSALGKHDVAEQLWRRVLAIREKSLPHNDPAIISALNSLADACASQGEHEEALHFRERGARLQAQVGGPNRPEAATEEKAAPDRRPTPAASEPSITPLPSLPPVPPQSVQQSRITPIPLAPIAPAPGKVEPFSPGTSGGFSPFAPPPPPGLAGIAPGIGGPTPTPAGVMPGIGGPTPTPARVMPGIGGPTPTPVGVMPGIGGPTPTPAGVVPGIGGPTPTPVGMMPGIGGPPLLPAIESAGVEAPALPPEPRSPSMPNGVASSFGGFGGPAPAPPRVVASPPAPPPAPRERAPAPPRRRSEPSLERPRYDAGDESVAPPRRGVAGKVITGLAIAAGIGFAALALGRGKDVQPVEAAVADTAQAEERVIRIPAESLRVGRNRAGSGASASTITLDSALAASHARNALDTGTTLGVAADSGPKPIVVPSARTLEALSRAVDAGLKPSLDSVGRAPAPTTPDFRNPK